MDLIATFEETVRGPWETEGYDVQFRVVDEGEMAIVSFQGSVSKKDWELNFDFIAQPYKHMDEVWYAHRGFAEGYKSVNDIILSRIKGKKFVFIEGYSLGAAYAQLCHEDIRYNYPLIDCGTILFGAPRVFWMPPKSVKERCKDILRVQNYGDMVGTIPPAWFGFQHIGEQKTIGSLRYFLKNIFPIKKWDDLPGAKMHLMSSYREALKGDSIERQTRGRKRA